MPQNNNVFNKDAEAAPFIKNTFAEHGNEIEDIISKKPPMIVRRGTLLLFFFLLSLTALLSAVLLWRREAGPHGHNLESARAGA